MATIDVTNAIQDLTHPSAHAHVYQAGHIPVAIDFAAVLAKKGSALAAGDVIRVFKIPPKTIVNNGWLEVLQASAANLTTCTLNVGTEVADPARFISGFNYKTATVGTFAADAATPNRIIVGNVTNEYLVVTIATLTGVLDSGIINVASTLLDVADRSRTAGLATRT